MKYTYKTDGTCSRAIRFDIDRDGILTDVHFEGGCPGNTLGLATMCRGRRASEVADALRGVDCRNRGTSCPDQLARAIDQALADK